MTAFYVYTSELSGQTFVVEPTGEKSYVVHPASHPAYLAWLSEGNTPEEWNPDGTL